jgi:hypothetical protein
MTSSPKAHVGCHAFAAPDDEQVNQRPTWAAKACHPEDQERKIYDVLA